MRGFLVYARGGEELMMELLAALSVVIALAACGVSVLNALRTRIDCHRRERKTAAMAELLSEDF